MKTHEKPVNKTIQVLVVEDSPSDAALLKEILESSGLPVKVNLAKDGVEAVAFLKRRGRYLRSPRPVAILLDLNLPRTGGLAVLAKIKADPRLARIPVCILTGSKREEDMKAAFLLKADHYFEKPMDLSRFGVLVKFLQEVWVKTLEQSESPQTA